VKGQLRHVDCMLVLQSEKEDRPAHEKLSEMRSWEGCTLQFVVEEMMGEGRMGMEVFRQGGCFSRQTVAGTCYKDRMWFDFLCCSSSSLLQIKRVGRGPEAGWPYVPRR